MNVPHVLKVRCHFCSKEREVWRIHQLGTAAQMICDHCVEWHIKATEFLAGGGMPGCQCCLATWEVLRDSTPGVEIRLYVVPKDGIYQVLCATCIGPYVSRRVDLYAGTPFGAQLRLA